MRELRIATGTSRSEKVWKNTVTTWEELTERLGKTTRTSETQKEYKDMPKSRQDEIKDVGGFVGGYLRNGSRKAVESRDILTLDADFASADFCEQLEIFLSCAWCVYSTHKHTKENPRLRLVIPLDRSVNTEEYEAVARKVADNIGIDQFDDTTYQAQRLMYWGSTSLDGDWLYETSNGDALCVDEVLAKYKNWQDVTEWPVSGRTIQARERILKKQEDPTEKKGVVGAFCRTYTVEEVMEKFIPGVYIQCDVPDRYTYAAGSTAAGAVLYDDGKFLYSNHATDPASGILCNAFDLVRLHKFADLDEEAKEGTPTSKKPSYLKMTELAVADEGVRKTMYQEKMEDSMKDFEGISGSDEAEDNNWILSMDVDGKGNYLPTVHNVKTVLSHDALLKGKIRKNEFTRRYRVFGEMPWDKRKEERDWMDVDDAGLRYYLEKGYQIKGKAVIEDGWTLVATENRYHPVRDYLEGLVWDGIPRVEKLFIDYMGAEDSEYTKRVTRMSLIASVARIFIPGVKYDNVPVLVGPQGCGKSTMLKKLGVNWFSDTLTTMQGKEAYEQIQGFWIIEIGELAAMRKYEMETVKLFTSKCEDSYRAAYGHHVETYRRQCVFFGTTNTHDFLKDMTGNRRFWPIDAEPDKAVKSVWALGEEEVNQIWAEAVHMFKAGGTFYIESEELKRMAEAVQESHMEENPLTGDILEFLEKPIPKSWDSMDIFARQNYMQGGDIPFDVSTDEMVEREKVCALEIWCEMWNGNKHDLTRQKAKEINDIIEKTGEWERPKTGIRFAGMYGYQRGFLRRVKH